MSDEILPISKPWYKSLKKTLGCIGFILYWALQIAPVIKDPSVLVSMAVPNISLILGLLGIKKFGDVMQNRIDK